MKEKREKCQQKSFFLCPFSIRTNSMFKIKFKMRWKLIFKFQLYRIKFSIQLN